MIQVRSIFITALVLILYSFAVQASGADMWFDIEQRQSEAMLQDKQANGLINAKSDSGRILGASIEQLTQILFSDDLFKRVSIPLPDGTTVEYQLSDAPVVAPALLEKYPQIRTLKGYQVDQPENQGRFDITPHGFHAMLEYNNETVFIDPQLRGNDQRYISYYKKDASPLSSQVQDVVSFEEDSALALNQSPLARRSSSDSILRTYRIAVSASGEYTAFHGGIDATKEDGLAAIVTMLNRVNQIYERDLAIHLELVAANDEIIFTNSVTDPFDNTDDDRNTNTSVLREKIGDSNYDIGHVVNTGGGGAALVGVVCTRNKGVAVTGSFAPTGDSFYIDYVAHEIGHQFGADHSYNGSSRTCGDQRIRFSAYEPGSGSTIMAYAGICAPENLQLHSDAYFHARSLEQIMSFVSFGNGSSCGDTQAMDNISPVADAGANYIIPANTPFKLTGEGTDINGDALTYVWEQYDLGTQSSSPETMVDDGSRPIFRSWSPSSSSVRYLPLLTDVLEGTSTLGESFATTDRELNFRLTVRDGNGGTSNDDMSITVLADAGPFRVTAPLSGDAWVGTESQTVTWDVANTTASPINCPRVDITLTADGSENFDTVILSGTNNDGEQTVTAPNIDTDSARVMVACQDNIFFAVNDGAISITSVEVPDEPVVSDDGGDRSSSSGGGGGSMPPWWLSVMVAAMLLHRRHFRYSP